MNFAYNNLPAALACAAALTFSGCTGDPLPPGRNIPARPAPDFSIQTIDGKTLGSAKLKGKIVIVNFWSVWSPTCAREIPDLMQIRNSFGEDSSRIVIVGICLESKALQDTAEFVRETGIDYPVSFQDTDFADLFGGIDTIPTTFVIDTEWRLVNRYTGRVFRDELHHELSYMLGELRTVEKEREKR